MTVHDLTLSVVTPVHIGTGDVLRLDLDFAIGPDRATTRVLNVDAILAQHIDTLLAEPGLTTRTPRSFLKPNDFDNAALFRYALPGVPRSEKVAAELRAALKDPFDVPYIPGSSLKGALRTALAWAAWRDTKRQWSPSELGRSGSWAAQPLEREIFGRDPNHDLLRALKVSDLRGPTRPGESLRVINAQARTVGGGGAPISVEAIRPDTVFRGQLVIDEHLFAPPAERVLHFGERRRWLDDLALRVQAHSQDRLGSLITFFEAAEGGETIAAFYRQLQRRANQPGMMLIQLGWGGGWDSKTFGSHLRENTVGFDEIIRIYRLQKRSRSAPPRKSGDRFPASRRVAVTYKDNVGQPAAPLGWCLLELRTPAQGGNS